MAVNQDRPRRLLGQLAGGGRKQEQQANPRYRQPHHHPLHHGQTPSPALSLPLVPFSMNFATVGRRESASMIHPWPLCGQNAAVAISDKK